MPESPILGYNGTVRPNPSNPRFARTTMRKPILLAAVAALLLLGASQTAIGGC